LFALVPSISRYGQEARSYGFAVAAAVLATLLLLRAAEQPRIWQRWLAYAGSLVLLAGLHLIALGLLVAHATLLFAPRARAPWLTLRRGLLLPWLVAVSCAVALIAPLAWLGSQQSAQIAWSLTLRARLSALPNMIFHARLLGTCVIGLGLVALHRPERGRVLIAGWAIVPPVLLYLTHPQLHLFVHRYLLFTLPAWTLLAALTVDDVAQSRLFARARWAKLLLPLVLVSWVPWLGVREQRRIRTPTKNAEQHAYLEVADLLRRESRTGDAIAFGGAGGARHWPRLGLLYELRTEPMPRDVFVEQPLEQHGWFTAYECREPARCLPDDVTRLWLVTSTDGSDVFMDMPRARAALLRSTFGIERVVQFNKVKVVLLERSRGSS
jgi:mannosyltransferase